MDDGNGKDEKKGYFKRSFHDHFGGFSLFWKGI